MTKLVCVPGIVIAASRVKSKATRVTLECRTCGNTTTVHAPPGLGGLSIPPRCTEPPAAGGARCGPNTFVQVLEQAAFLDQQTLKLQENPEDVPAGEMPRNLLLLVERHAVQRCVPGTRVTVLGIYSIHKGGQQSRGDNKGAVAIRHPYLRVLGISADGDGTQRATAQFSDPEVRQFKA